MSLGLSFVHEECVRNCWGCSRCLFWDFQKRLHNVSASLLSGTNSTIERSHPADVNPLIYTFTPLLSPSLHHPWYTICRPGRGSTLNTRLVHKHTNTRQSPHQVWLIWLVTRVSRAITSIQMFHSLFVCTPNHTHTRTYRAHTCFHAFSLPPVVEDVMLNVACCCFAYSCFAFCSLWAVTICSASEERGLFFPKSLKEIASAT